jgi:23S rRNA (adenine-N6)-dimethyltransferase
MFYRQRRLPIYYSQNFLRDPKLIDKLVRESSLCNNDTVLEIGSGKGIITKKLLKVAHKVIAIENDWNLYKKLKISLDFHRNCILEFGNILNYELLNSPYKVFANIPFNLTTKIIHKLTSDDNFLEGYLIVQKEAAKRFVGMPYDRKNQMVSVLLKPWFNISVIYEFKKSDFTPYPGVNCTMIRINRLSNPLINNNRRSLYRDYIVYSYNKFKYSRKDYKEILQTFNGFCNRHNKTEENKVRKEASKIRHAQNIISKIYRTRKDKNWKSFKNRF